MLENFQKNIEAMNAEETALRMTELKLLQDKREELSVRD